MPRWIDARATAGGSRSRQGGRGQGHRAAAEAALPDPSAACFLTCRSCRHSSWPGARSGHFGNASGWPNCGAPANRAPRRPDNDPARGEELPRGGPGGHRRAPPVDRPRLRDRRPPGGGARGLAGRSRVGRGPRAADRPGLRAQRAGPRRDGRPGRGPGGLAERPCPGPGRQRPGTPPAHARPRPICPRSPAASCPAIGSCSTDSCSSCSVSATSRSSKWPVGASSPGGAGSSMSSRPARPCPSGSSCSATRSIRCAASTRPTSARPSGSARSSSCRPPNSSSRPAARR